MDLRTEETQSSGRYSLENVGLCGNSGGNWDGFCSFQEWTSARNPPAGLTGLESQVPA